MAEREVIEERLRLARVTARYGAGPPELREVDLDVREGELVCVMGPNGAGKTTLVRVASGLLAPEAGHVSLDGEDLGALGRDRVARALAVVQQIQEAPPGYSVRDVVTMGRAPHQGGWMRASADDARVVEAALARCDLVAIAERAVSTLSGGEQKRVAVARALAQEPSVLLLDEPGAFLDVRHELELYELLAAEVRGRRLACLVVMHDLNVAAQFADRVVLMKGGSVVAAGTVAEVMTWRTLKETFGVDLYCGENDLTGARFFLPMRRR